MNKILILVLAVAAIIISAILMYDHTIPAVLGALFIIAATRTCIKVGRTFNQERN